MQRYETVVIFDADLAEEAQKANIEKIQTIVASHGGSIVRQDFWGKRRLSFSMKKKDYGFYVVLVLEGDNSMVADLERQLRITDSVLRYLTVRKDEFAPDFRVELTSDTYQPVPVEEDGAGDALPDGGNL